MAFSYQLNRFPHQIRIPSRALQTRALYPVRRASNWIHKSHSIPLKEPQQSFSWRAASTLGLCLAFTTLGFVMATAPAYESSKEMLKTPTDSETLRMFNPEDEEARVVEAFIDNHKLAISMRSRPTFRESRPHLKIPSAHRQHNLTGGTLMGPGKVVVPPVVWAEEGGKSLVTLSYLGTDLCGHPGIVHGGFLATMLDEGLARCCFAALPHNIGLTANLNVNYRSPARAGTYVVLKAKTTKVEGRKAWVEGHLETLATEGESPVVIADATALFISPKAAAAMSAVSPTTVDK